MVGFENLGSIGKAVSIVLRDACDTFILHNCMEDYCFLRVLDKVDQLFLSDELAHKSFVVHFFL